MAAADVHERRSAGCRKRACCSPPIFSWRCESRRASADDGERLTPMQLVMMGPLAGGIDCDVEGGQMQEKASRVVAGDGQSRCEVGLVRPPGGLVKVLGQSLNGTDRNIVAIHDSESIVQ